MTIPSAPQIGSTGLVQQPGILQQILPVLEAVSQHKLANAQIESYQGLTAERRAAAAEAARKTQDAADAAKAFYAHLSGSAQRLKPPDPNKPGDHQGVDETSGMLIPLPQFERGLSPGAHAAYMQMISDHNAAIKQGFDAAKSQVDVAHQRAVTNLVTAQGEAARAQNEANTAVGNVLARYAGKLGDPQQQARALADVASIDPQQAEGLARAFNVGSGRFAHVLALTGEPYSVDTKTGQWLRQPGNLGTRVNALSAQEAQMVGQQAHDIHQRMEALLRASPDADALSLYAQGARNVRGKGFAGAAVGTLEPLLLTPAQQEFAQLGDNLVHLQASLLPKGQRSMGIMENLRGSFIPVGHASDQARRSARRTRQELDKTFFLPLANGRSVDMRRFPGWIEAANASLEDARSTQSLGGAPNPADWLQGPPP